VSNSSTIASNRENTACPKHNDDISLLIPHNTSSPVRLQKQTIGKTMYKFQFYFNEAQLLEQVTSICIVNSALEVIILLFRLF
jgi:hypothetical protein